MSGYVTGDPCERLDYVECRIAAIIWKIFGPISLIVGLCGNILSVAVLSRKRMCVFTTSVYLRFLAVVDSLVLLFSVLRDLVYHYTNIDFGELSDLTCKIFQWLNYTVTALSGWILCAIAIDRLIAVKHPLWTKSHCTKGIAISVTISLTAIVFLMNIHVLLFMYRDEIYVDSNATNASFFLDVKCSPMTTDYITFNTKVWPILTFIIYGIAPIVCLISCNIILYRQLSQRSLNKQASRTVGDAAKKREKDMKSLTKMLIVVCVAFVTFSVPTCIYLIIAPYVFTRTSAHDIAKRRLTWVIVASFLYCNNTLNFIIYCISGSLFRQELHGLFVQVKLSVLKCIRRRIVPTETIAVTGAVQGNKDDCPRTSTNVVSNVAQRDKQNDRTIRGNNLLQVNKRFNYPFPGK